MELVVTDDGSTDETPQIVERFAQTVDFPVQFTTHEHRTFQLARCRNEGAAASVAPHLLFVDGDCILPPDFVAQHLAQRRPATAFSGDCLRMEEAISARVDEAVIRSGVYRDWVLPAESQRLAKVDRKSRLYSWIRHRSKPKLFGGNVGIWRSDFERVNGYDEDFEGWGCEDDDLARCLRRVGLRIQSIMRWTRAYHLWHPREATAPALARRGQRPASVEQRPSDVCHEWAAKNHGRRNDRRCGKRRDDHIADAANRRTILRRFTAEKSCVAALRHKKLIRS